MNILHICNMTMNGKATMLVNMLENIDLSTYNITIFNFHGEIDSTILNRINNLNNIKIFNSSNNLFKSLIELNYLLKNNKFHIVHSHFHDLNGLFLLVAKINGVKIRISHCHNSGKAKHRYGYLKEFIRDKIIWRILKLLTIKVSTAYLACSYNAGQWLYGDKICIKKLLVLNNGLNIEKFCNIQLTKEEIIHKFNLPSDKQLLLFVGRFSQQKNPLFVIDVLYQLTLLNNNIHLIMVGDGIMKNDILKHISDTKTGDKITIINNTAHINLLMSISQCLILPSLYEGLPVTLLEAQALKLNCVCSNNITQDVQCGKITFLDLTSNAKQWATIINEILNGYSVLTLNYEQLEKYDIKQTSNLLCSFYNQLFEDNYNNRI